MAGRPCTPTALCVRSIACSDDGSLFVTHGDTIAIYRPDNEGKKKQQQQHASSSPPPLLSRADFIDPRRGYKEGPVASAQFSDPTALVHSQGKLYVVDQWNHCIRAIDLKTRELAHTQLRD